MSEEEAGRLTHECTEQEPVTIDTFNRIKAALLRADREATERSIRAMVEYGNGWAWAGGCADAIRRAAGGGWAGFP